MFLKAGALSLALLLASRLLGLVRESAQAAAFGASGMADVAVLMLTLPDWLAGVLASGALAYVLLPAWAGQATAQVAGSQRRVAGWLLGAGAVLAAVLAVLRVPVAAWVAPGLPPGLQATAAQALLWSAAAVPAALLAGLWGARLQHERDFGGLYGANLVVNVLLILAILGAASAASWSPVTALGTGLLAAMLLRLAWQKWRLPTTAAAAATDLRHELPAASIWLWAGLSAGLPLLLPFAARTIASASGAGALATFNYAGKLVELPLVLAIQLVAALAFPRIAQGLAPAAQGDPAPAIRAAVALAWTLACAAAAALLIGAPALSQLLFGWGRMEPGALSQVAAWGAAGAWGLLPQAVIAVSLTVLAARSRMRVAVWAYAAALAALLLAGWAGWRDGGQLMLLLNALLAGVALACLSAMGPEWRGWIPWRSAIAPTAALVAVALVARLEGLQDLPLAGGLVAALLAAAGVAGCAWLAGADLRVALRR